MTLQNATQQDPKVIVGLAANRPNPVGMPGGTIFFASDTGVVSVVGISITGTRSWDPASGSAMKFWGGAAASRSTVFAGDTLPTVTTLQATAIQYPISFACTVMALRVFSLSNTFADVATFTIFKNGVATTITLNVTAGSTGQFSDLVHSASFAPGDTVDLQITSGFASGGGNIIEFSASVQFAAT
jgi:hypothetical protein